MDIITKNQIAQKSEIYIHPSFKPLTLNVKKAIEIVNKFEMIPPSGAAGGAQKVPGLHTGKAAQGGYSSGNEGLPSAAGGGPGIEIDPFTGIPYYDASKASKSVKARGGSLGPPAAGNRRIGSMADAVNQMMILCYGDHEDILKYVLD